jgi:hypothetical protein
LKVLTAALTALVLTAGGAFAMCSDKVAEPRVDGPGSTAETPIVLPGPLGS